MSLRSRTPIVVTAIIAINIVVYLMWTSPSFVDPAFMERHFLVSWSSLAEGRWWTAITSAFSQNMIWHLALNMFVFWSFGSPLEREVGPKTVLMLYVVAGVIGSCCHALAAAYVLGDPDVPSIGASGAISGVVMAFALLFPRAKLFLFGFIPMPALVGVIAFAGLDVWGLIAQAEGGGLPIGHGAHLGGAAAGAILYFTQIRGRFHRYP